MLALDGVCLFYIGTKPFILEAKPGNMARKEKGQTHKIVLDEFEKQKTVPYLLSQSIGLTQPLDWLMEKREEANYRNAKFWEPIPPAHFEKIMGIGVRRAINAYLSDTTGIYLFDPSHAILAYPLRALEYAFNKLKTRGLTLSDNDIRYLRQLFRDRDGPIPDMYNMIESDGNQ
ncbi:hypothetical protein HYR99_12735, partial [Candidatus Poribacteria bacterium]|nr:hypothetical protein [Candidatus Poribacteria bacterium]